MPSRMQTNARRLSSTGTRRREEQDGLPRRKQVQTSGMERETAYRGDG
jgi:hypothetical protein